MTTSTQITEQSTSAAKYLVLGTLVGLACWFSVNFTHLNGPVSTIWIASGLLTGVLISSERRLWIGYLVAALAGHLIARMIHGDAWYLTLGLSLTTILESWMVAFALVYFVGDLDSPAKIKRVGKVAVCSNLCASAITAVIAASILTIAGTASFVSVLGTWFVAHTLGMAIFATLTAVALRRGRRLLGRPGQRLEFALTLALIAVVCLGVFTHTHYSLAFLIYPPLLYCIFRNRFDGVVLGVTIVVIVSITLTLTDNQSAQLVRDYAESTDALLLQLFLAVTCLLAFPIAIVLAETSYLTLGLRESEQRYRVIADYASDLVLRIGADGQRLYISPSAKEMLGWDPEELGGPRWDKIHPDDAAAFMQALQHLYAVGGVSITSCRARHKDGHYVWLEVHARLVPSADVGSAPEIIASCRDITRRKEAEQGLERQNAELQALNQKLAGAQTQLLQSEKMASVGLLAAGVAHEINNPIGYVRSNLTSLTGYLQNIFSVLNAYEQFEKALAATPPQLAAVQALKQRIELDYVREDIVNLLAESVEGVTRVEKIVSDLKDFSHIGQAEWELADVHDCIDSTLNVVAHEIKYKGALVKEYGDLPPIQCMPFQLKQVFMNLLINAAHSIERSGTITIRTGREGERVWISISDTGQGIDPSHINRIFEPFFTTKPIGVGTGLGLSVSYSIIKKHGGTLDVASVPGNGTTFTIRLPIIAPTLPTSEPGALGASLAV
jgi:two-component system NtrC family sensor kinase